MLGNNQLFTLELIYDKPDTVASLTWSFMFDNPRYRNDFRDATPDITRQCRFVVRRALVAMEKRGLVERAGMAESVTPPFCTDEDPASAYAGERVPKGYSRQSVLWRITPKGRQAVEDERATRPGYHPTPEQREEQERILKALSKLF